MARRSLPASSLDQTLKSLSPSRDRRTVILTVKTPLLPRHSGINMESAKAYGADIEKRALADAAEAEWKRERYEQKVGGDEPRPRRHTTVKWIAALALFSVTAVAVIRNGIAFRHAESVTMKGTAIQSTANDNERRAPASTNSSSNSTTPLVPFTYRPLPLGSIKPMGWLADQMEGLANGLAGHEMDFYPIVQNNYWIGGDTDYSPLNEGYPYWFNGLVPLAYGIDDQRLIGQVQSSVSYVLAHQNLSTGWLGPEQTYDSTQLWARFPFCLGLMNLADADSSMVPQILNALYRFIPLMYELLDDGKSVNEVWGRARYQDMIVTLEWLYETHPQYNGTDMRPLLMNTMYKLQSWGHDWAGYYSPNTYFFQDIDDIVPAVGDNDAYFPFLHGVNVGQGLKTMSVDYRFTHNSSLLPVQKNAIDWTMQYHGAASGTVIGDERESGMAPNRGSELCTAVETMYSEWYAYAVTGENEYADHAELTAFNALPVMMTPDNWAHQYIAQPNQPWSSQVDGGAVFWNVGDYGITYGLAPNYPCCAVNHPQGYPKFTSATFMAVGDSGLGHVLLSPSNVTTTLGNGAQVNVLAITDYPFSDILNYKITTDKPFTFYVRVPGWAQSPTLTMNGKSIAATASQGGSLIPIPVSAGQTTVQYVLTSTLRVLPRANDTIAVYHGALLYALDVGMKNTSVVAVSDVTRNQPPTNDPAVQIALEYNTTANNSPSSEPSQARDYNISNTLPWNYAIDPTSLQWFATNVTPTPAQGESVNGTDDSGASGESAQSDASGDPPALANPIWDYHAPTAFIRGQACLINWDLLGNMPFRPPLANDRNCQSEPTEVILRPYGSLKVHMAELPTTSFQGQRTNSTTNSTSSQ